MAKGKPQELLAQAAVRARVAEVISPHVGLVGRETDLFLLGSLSLVDTMLGRPMRDVLSELPLGDDLTNALLGGTNDLRKVLDLVYERGDWVECERGSADLGFEGQILAKAYTDGVRWAGDIFRS